MSRKTHLLNAMGIDRWRLREPSAGELGPQAAYYIKLLNNQHCVGVIVAEGALRSEEEAALVQAMSKATGYLPEGAWEEALPERSVLCEPGVMVVLGAHLASALLGLSGEVANLRQDLHRIGSCVVIVTHSPAALLANVSLKAEAWHDIKKAIQLMKGVAARDNGMSSVEKK